MICLHQACPGTRPQSIRVCSHNRCGSGYSGIPSPRPGVTHFSTSTSVAPRDHQLPAESAHPWPFLLPGSIPDIPARLNRCIRVPAHPISAPRSRFSNSSHHFPHPDLRFDLIRRHLTLLWRSAAIRRDQITKPTVRGCRQRKLCRKHRR